MHVAWHILKVFILFVFYCSSLLGSQVVIISPLAISCCHHVVLSRSLIVDFVIQLSSSIEIVSVAKKPSLGSFF